MPEKTIYFSVNLNPLGPPQIISDYWQSWKSEIIDYPDPLGEKLKNKTSRKEVLHPDNILLGNGAAELIQLIAIYFREKRIGLFQPTFSEYERMTSAYGAELTNLSIDRLNDKDYLERVVKKRCYIPLSPQ